MSECKIANCFGSVVGFGMCSKHYQRFKRYGDPHSGKRNHATVEERFWRNVQKTESCWFWLGTKSRNAYGIIGLGGRDKKYITAHRLSYKMHHGDIPDKCVVMHSCDNPSCVNPDHLSIGTYKDNALDAIAKGRHARITPKGSKNGKSVLNEQKVLYIRSRPDVSHAKLAAELGVSASCIRGVRSGRTWGHIT